MVASFLSGLVTKARKGHFPGSSRRQIKVFQQQMKKGRFFAPFSTSPLFVSAWLVASYLRLFIGGGGFSKLNRRCRQNRGLIIVCNHKPGWHFYFLLCRQLEFEDQVTFSDSIKLIEKCITRKTWSALHIVHNEERIVLCLAGNVGQRALGRHPA